MLWAEEAESGVLLTQMSSWQRTVRIVWLLQRYVEYFCLRILIYHLIKEELHDIIMGLKLDLLGIKSSVFLGRNNSLLAP